MDCFEFMVKELLLSYPRTEEESLDFVENVLLSQYNITKESE